MSSSCLTAAGTVVRVAEHGRFEVELAAPPRCRACSGACAWRRPDAVHRGLFASPHRFAVGDAVVVRLPERYLLLGSLLLYGLPLTALICGAAAGAAVTGSDLGTALGAVAATAAAWVTTPRLRRRLEQRTLQRLELRLETNPNAAAPSL
ncbi:MAG TPA: SoxR reducing system RseC family protein [Gammaproteobacteria bacterium]|nr:SoxR reducing system RseC family protein [Gammaproteobacteria bacterium]